MTSFINSSSRPSTEREVQHILFTQDDAMGVHYLHFDALVARAMVA